MDFGGGSAEAWLTSFTQQLRVQLPQGQFILTHARMRLFVTQDTLLTAMFFESPGPMVLTWSVHRRCVPHGQQQRRKSDRLGAIFSLNKLCKG